MHKNGPGSPCRPQRTFRAGALACVVAGSCALLPAEAWAAPFEAALRPTLDKIDRFVESERRAALIPGMALALVRDGKIVHLKGYGEARPGVPAGPDTGFVLGSVGKSMTAMAIAQLTSEGRVDLDAPVRKYLPAFKTADPLSDSITVRELVVHMSGFSTIDGRRALTDPSSRSIGRMLGALSRLKLAFTPGTRFRYSNWNYAILGGIIEAASGMDYPEYMQSHIFACPSRECRSGRDHGTPGRVSPAQGLPAGGAAVR
jgi:CubicO group peptidase (beta-lactamase class C family)